MGFFKVRFNLKLFLGFLFFGIFLYTKPARSQFQPRLVNFEIDSNTTKADPDFYLSNPSAWIQARLNLLSKEGISLTTLVDVDSYNEKIETIANSEELIRLNLSNHANSLRLRDVREYKVELLSDIDDLLKLLSKLNDQNNILTKQTLEAAAIQNEINYFNVHADSSIRIIYQAEISLLSNSLNEARSEFSKHLKLMVGVESMLNKLALELRHSNRIADELIIKKESEFYKANLPPLWKSIESNYPSTLYVTIKKTIIQAYSTLAFFGSHSFIGLILFRIFLFLLCFIPVHFYKKNSYNENEHGTSQYLHKYPGLAPAIMGLVLAPVIFVNPPYVFLDFVLISLTISAAIIYYKENKFISLYAFTLIVVYYITLKLINLFVTPTFYGRIIYCSAIVLLVPFQLIFNDLRNNNYSRKKTARVVYFFLMLQLVTGCTLTTIGYYSLGRMILLSAFDALILLLILKVSIFTFLDYLRMVANYLNSKIQSFAIDPHMVEKFVSPLIRTLAVLFFIMSYLKNLNLYDNWIGPVDYAISRSRVIGDTTFTFSSLLVFVIIIWLAFYFSRFLTQTIEPHESYVNGKKRNSVGSYILLIRFILIVGGFILGIRASGIPLTQFTVVMGALGVGIGFGLQNIFNNLVSGLILVFEKPISIGDLIEVGEETGKVISIGIRATVMSTGEGADILIPNGKLLSAEVKNWTLTSPDRLAHLFITVANENDPELVQQLISGIIETQPSIIKKEKATIAFESIGNNGMKFHTRFWVREIFSIEKIKSDVMHQIYAEFKANNITYPKDLNYNN